MSISITQDVRDMVFKGPMSSSDMKHYDEHLALAILKYCFDDYDHLIVKDAPDLQSPECSIGIEVTEVAISRNKAIEGDYLQYRKTKNKKYIEKINKSGGKATNDYYIVTPVTKHDELDAMKTVFQKKLKKIVDYRDKGFKTIGLVMLMTEPPIPQTAFEWGTMIHSINSNSEYRYDKVFFTYPSALSILDCSTGTVEYIVIDHNDYDALKKYARKMAEK